MLKKQKKKLVDIGLTLSLIILKAVVLSNMSKNISLKLKKMAKKSVFYTY